MLAWLPPWTGILLAALCFIAAGICGLEARFHKRWEHSVRDEVGRGVPSEIQRARGAIFAWHAELMFSIRVVLVEEAPRRKCTLKRAWWPWGVWYYVVTLDEKTRPGPELIRQVVRQVYVHYRFGRWGDGQWHDESQIATQTAAELDELEMRLLYHAFGALS